MTKRPPFKKTKSDLSAVSKVLQTLLANGKSPLSDQFLRWKLWRFWPQVVGATWAKACEPVGFERGRLFLWVRSSAQLQELRFFEDSLKLKVNEYMGREWVYSIRFTLDRKGIPLAADTSEEFKRFLETDAPGPESEK
jgi:hypothetical protein